MILAEQHPLVESRREGEIDRDVYRELLADADARLLEADEPQTSPGPPQHGAQGDNQITNRKA